MVYVGKEKMTETKVSLQIGNQPFARQRQATAQIQNAIVHSNFPENDRSHGRREALKKENRGFA